VNNVSDKLKKKFILVVDDETDVRSMLCTTLTSGGYSVIEAKDGRIAAAMVARQVPDLILADMEMPIMDGLSLLEKVRAISPVPFVMMLSDQQMADEARFRQQGVSDVVQKPLISEAVLAVVDIVLSQGPDDFTHVKQSDVRENYDLDFCRLSIDEFVSGRVSLADIFVRIKETKYIQVARKDNELSFDRIDTYKRKGLHFLYIRKEDFSRYIGLNLELTKRVMEKNVVTKPQRLRLLKHTSEMLLQDTFINGVDKEKMASSAALVEAMVSTLSDDPEIFNLLEILQTHSDHLYAHSLGVALYSAMVAKHIGWTSTPTLFKVTMGGLLHDIGKKEIDPSILQKRRQDLSAAERSLYETHPVRGKEILCLIKSVPEDVAQISMHHHENATGCGFPCRLLKTKIHPLAKLIAVTNVFCEMALKGPTDAIPLSATDALNRIYSLQASEIDLSFLRALMELFSHPIPEDMPKTMIPSLKN